LQEALFVVHREGYSRYVLGSFKSPFTLKMEAVYSSETSVLLTRSTRHHVSEYVILQDVSTVNVELAALSYGSR
jgi:hypothetical protein